MGRGTERDFRERGFRNQIGEEEDTALKIVLMCDKDNVVKNMINGEK